MIREEARRSAKNIISRDISIQREPTGGDIRNVRRPHSIRVAFEQETHFRSYDPPKAPGLDEATQQNCQINHNAAVSYSCRHRFAKRPLYQFAMNSLAIKAEKVVGGQQFLCCECHVSSPDGNEVRALYYRPGGPRWNSGGLKSSSCSDGGRPPVTARRRPHASGCILFSVSWSRPWGQPYNRYVLAWQLSNTLDGLFCLDALRLAFCKGQPKIFDTDPGAQFTTDAFTDCRPVRDVSRLNIVIDKLIDPRSHAKSR